MSADATRIYFQRAADHLDLSDAMRRLLLTAKREVQVQIPVELDSGEVATFIGYRVQHNNARGPMKGGLRYHPQVDLDEVRVGPQERPLFAADSVSVRVAPLQALSKTLALDDVSVVRPRVNLILPPADPGARYGIR